MPRLCTSAVVGPDTIVLDGETFPFWVTDDVEIEGLTRDELTVLRIGVVVDGVAVVLDRHGKRTVVDPELGDVGAYARRVVREGLLEAFPWLAVPA
jgi:hypothetical protein